MAGMERELKNASQGNALVLAVQAVIAANDAYTIRHLGLRCASERHDDAVYIFSRVANVDGMKLARRHLEVLLEAKGRIEYSGKPVKPEKAEGLAGHARRFVEFVRKNLE